MKAANYDAVIIGFGKGGKTLAGKLAGAGKSVAMIERNPMMYGGTCINTGCIPTKSLINSSKAADPRADSRTKAEIYRAAVEEKRRVTGILRKKNYEKLASLSNVTIYDGEAHFTGERQVEVLTKEGAVTLTGEQVFINTGSVSRIPDIEGIKEVKGVYASAGLMDLEVFPERLTIIGGGYIGLEFASIYSSFGSKVIVLQDGDVFLPREDEDIAAEMKKILEARGIQFFLGAKIKKVENGPRVIFDWMGEEQRVESDAVLVAAGRVPDTAALHCEAAGVKVTERGAVLVDENLQTTAPNIWAMGDVTGGLQHTYISLDDYRIVSSQIMGGKKRTAADRKYVPYSVFIDIPYSRVGMNEKEAIAKGHKVKIARMPVAAIPKSQILKSTEGVLKAVIDQETNKILGAMLLCEESFEAINIIKLAMDLNADYTVLRDQIFTHPTMSESFNDLFSV